MVVCNYAVWQYREEGIAEGSRKNLLKNYVMLMGSWLWVMLGVGYGWEMCFMVRPS
jgi:hypothetical protein